VSIQRPTSPDGKPDIADVLYGIHRCCHAHGDELPEGFALLRDAAGPARLTRMEIERGKIRLSDRMIFGLLAAAVLSSANKSATDSKLNSYYLTFGGSAKLIINEWWGRAKDFPAIAAQDPTPILKLDFKNWDC
jgi:hypothetical protein